jgi:gliding motility-associated-like protein
MASDTIIRRKKTLCSGDVYTVGTQTYTKSGVYRDTFKRFNGCDSFVQSTLKFISDTTLNNTVSICQGDSIKVGKNIYKASDNYTDSLKKFAGCDSIIHTKLSVYPKYAQNKLIRLCPKESIVINGVNYNASTVFKYRYASVNGCDSVVNFTIIKSDLESIFDIDSTKNPVISFNNVSKKDVKFYWKFDQNSIDSTNRNVSKEYPNDSNRTFEICLIVKDSFGCVDTICHNLKMSKLLYYLFNTFTPNNDGYNDVYKIKTVGGSIIYSMEVYSRWGTKVFEVRDANSNDQSKLWNGKIMNNGADCPSGSYFALFRLYLNGSSKDPEIVNGVIMLIRE